jgi:hypothetical protein
VCSAASIADQKDAPGPAAANGSVIRSLYTDLYGGGQPSEEKGWMMSSPSLYKDVCIGLCVSRRRELTIFLKRNKLYDGALSYI